MNNELEHLCFDIGLIQETYQKVKKIVIDLLKTENQYCLIEV